MRPRIPITERLRFRKPETTHFGLSGDFYLTILVPTTALPAPNEVCQPKGLNGAVAAFLAPLSKDAPKDSLEKPMTRGPYAVASLDQKSMLRMLVMPKEEAGFEPRGFLQSEFADGFSDELRNRVAATWHLVQLSAASHDPKVIPTLFLMMDVAVRLAEKVGGVIADPMSHAYFLPEELKLNRDIKPFDVRQFVTIHTAGELVFTQGMIKFELPEMEITGVPESMHPTAGRFLLSVAQSVFQRTALEPGDKLGNQTAPFQVAHGGLDRARWEGIPCLELIPAPGKTTSECLASFASSPEVR